jgi:hypothetical protein
MKFELGEVVATASIAERMDSFPSFSLFVYNSLTRHIKGDWGELCQEDKDANDSAVIEGDRIVSSYNYSDNVKIWIITEWDRSVTTILYPSEY